MEEKKVVAIFEKDIRVKNRIEGYSTYIYIDKIGTYIQGMVDYTYIYKVNKDTYALYHISFEVDRYEKEEYDTREFEYIDKRVADIISKNELN